MRYNLGMEKHYEKVMELLRQEPFCIADPVPDETPIRDLKQWDSLKHLTLLVEVEKQFGTDLTAEKVQKIKTIRDLLVAINQDA